MNYVRFCLFYFFMTSVAGYSASRWVEQEFTKKIKLESGYAENVEKFLGVRDNEVGKDVTNYYGRHLVCKENFVNNSDYLMKQEMPADYQNKKDYAWVKEIPLTYVARMGKGSLVPILLAKGASLNKTNQAGLTPLMAAAYYGRVNMVEELLKREEINSNLISSYSSRNALHYALQANVLSGEKFHIALKLVAAKVSASLVDRELKTPMTEAIRHKNFILVREMLKEGYDINYRLPHQVATKIWQYDYATKKYEVIKTEKKSHAKTALMHVLELDKGKDEDLIKITALFLGEFDGGVLNLDTQDAKGNTALMYAVRAGNLKNVRALVERGADTDIQTLAKKNIYDLIITDATTEIQAYLTQVKKQKEAGTFVVKKFKLTGE